MYEKREEFNFIVDKNHVKLIVLFNIKEGEREGETFFEFKKSCFLVNKMDPSININCDMSLGEASYLVSILLYESIAELLEEQKDIIPSLAVFEEENTEFFEITINVNSEMGPKWQYNEKSTLCKVFLDVSAQELFEAVPNSYKNGKIITTLKYLSPLILYPALIHEFTHHIDHIAIAWKNNVEKRYERKAKIKELPIDETNLTVLLYRILGLIRTEGLATFCETYASEKKFVMQNKDFFIDAKSKLLVFVASLSKDSYLSLFKERYIIGYQLCMIIALAEQQSVQPIIKVINEKNIIEEWQVKDVVSATLKNKKIEHILITKNICAQIQKKILSTKNIAQFVRLYERACDTLHFPNDIRFLTWDSYRSIKEKIHADTLAGKKLITPFSEIKNFIKNLFV